MSIELITAFLGWCTLINVVALCLATLALMVMKGRVSAIHARMFGLNETELQPAYFAYLGNYKIAILMLNLVPWLALQIIA